MMVEPDVLARSRQVPRYYSKTWLRWRDPTVPSSFNPVMVLFERHMGAPVWEKRALVVDEQSYTYRGLFERVCQAANALQTLGIQPEQRVLLFGTDSADYIATWLGCVLMGAVPVVISDLYKASNLLYFMRDTAARALFIDLEQIHKVESVALELPDSLTSVAVWGAEVDDCLPTLSQTVSVHRFCELVSGAPTHLQAVPRHPHDIAYMLYSGGTTGPAKGITHLAHDFILIPERQGQFWDYSASDVVLATSKKYFTHGLWPGILMPLYYGATALTSHHAMTPVNIIRLIENFQATVLITVPTLVKNLMQHVRLGRTPEFGSLRLAVSASEKMPPQMFSEFHDTFGIELLDSIGSSELTYEWVANRSGDFRRGSLGKPVFGYEVKLVDGDGAEITEPGIPGEAWVKTQTACLYYWRKLEQTRQTFIGEWTRTGDILEFDSDGFFWYSSRKNDLFKVSGLWVSPLEIEAKITEHPQVLEAAIVGVEGDDGMTQVKAFVVLRPGVEPSDVLSDEIRANVRKLGGYKVPHHLQYVEALPRTTLLKIDRKTLLAHEQEG